MDEQLFPLVTIFMAFGAVAAIVYVTGQYVATEVRVHKRAGVVVEREPETSALFASVNTLVSTYFDEKRFGLEDSYKAKLRRDLLRAGFFHVQNVSYYIFVQVAAAVLLPGIACLFALTVLDEWGWPVKLGFVGAAFGVGNFGLSAFVSRRQRLLMVRYRGLFPDMLDLMVVCVDAGLSLEGALERISLEVMKQSRALGMNLVLLGAEMRAGRSLSEALSSLADRLGIDEARSFAAMLRQSIELGTDIGMALRVFSDEMRDRRLMRAEERANQLPVKMVLPLGVFIFPVIMIVIMFPVVVALMTLTAVR
jgi:tight adherence protein C